MGELIASYNEEKEGRSHTWNVLNCTPLEIANAITNVFGKYCDGDEDRMVFTPPECDMIAVDILKRRNNTRVVAGVKHGLFDTYQLEFLNTCNNIGVAIGQAVRERNNPSSP